MGNSDSKLNFRKAVVQLTSKTQNIDASDEHFWSQFWTGTLSNVNDIYTLIPSCEIRALREEAPANLASLCFHLIEKIAECSESTFISEKHRNSVLNCVRILTRLMPYIFEEPEWRGFFWSDSPVNKNDRTSAKNSEAPLAQTLLNSLISLLFMPDFTVNAHKKGLTNEEDRVKTIDSCEYIWEAGVGFSHSPAINLTHDYNRTEILKLILTTFSETIYLPPLIEYHVQPNLWITYFTSFKNQHALPLFTSLLNIIFAYDPVGYGLPYNYLMFTDSREQLVEVSCQLLCVALETNIAINQQNTNSSRGGDQSGEFLSSDERSGQEGETTPNTNLFISYLSRIHRDEDFSFILKGFCRLLNNPMTQTFLPGSCKKINFFQELLILFWKFCDHNKRFMYYVLKSTEILDILVPILYFLVDARADTSKTGLIHIGVFILLLLSGERNFGVRLNKPYVSRVPMDIPVFSGTHADLLIIAFHKLITSTSQRLQPLYDCLLTIIVNISPYIKSLCMVSSTKLLHLLEAFSAPTFLLANSNNYYLVFFLLEILNNMIQYQFDGNSNLIYTVIRKRAVFFQLLNLPTDQESIDQVVERQQNQQQRGSGSGNNSSKHLLNSSIMSSSTTEYHQSPVATTSSPTTSNKSMEGAIPAREAEPGTLKATLAETPSVLHMTEKTSTTATSNPIGATVTGNTEDGSFSYYTSNNTGGVAATSSAGVKQSSPTTSLNLMAENRLVDTSGSPTSSETVVVKKPPPPPSSNLTNGGGWRPSGDWVSSWKSKLPLQTIMRLLQVLVPQVEKICIDKGLTDESEILKFLQNGTLVGLLPVPHPILIRKYQPNYGTIMWFRTYMWGVIYLRNLDPPIWYDTDVKLFEIQRV